MKLYAVRIFVRSWDDACAFYAQKLKLAERFRNDELGWAEYDIGGPCIGLQRVGDDDDDEDGSDLVGRFVGIPLQVEDIEATYREPTDRGIRFTAAPQRQDWGGFLAHFEDPDGNVLTLLG